VSARVCVDRVRQTAIRARKPDWPPKERLLFASSGESVGDWAGSAGTLTEESVKLTAGGIKGPGCLLILLYFRRRIRFYEDSPCPLNERREDSKLISFPMQFHSPR